MLSEVKEGDVLAGKYRIERVLGRGGMGVVVAARHLQLDQRVALKFLLPGALEQPETVARFGREARAAVRIRSEHVARVTDVGTLESGAPYMVMEYLEGSDLSRRVAEEGPISIEETTGLLLQACEALAEAHSLGIVHRDLKPANLFLTQYPDGTAWLKILDFGISKLSASGTSAAEFDMTKTAAVMGSPFYMSPEQMRSTRDVDARTDIWSLGIVLYELVSGSVPFNAPTMPQLCGMVLQEAPPSLQAVRPEIPARFEALILRCLEKDPGRRFQSVAELAVALAEFAPKEAARSVARISRLSGIPIAIAKPVPDPSETELERGTRSAFGSTSAPRARVPGIVALIVLFTAGAGLAAFWWLGHSPPAGVASPSVSALPTPSQRVAETETSAVAPRVELVLPSSSPSSSEGEIGRRLPKQLSKSQKKASPASPARASAEPRSPDASPAHLPPKSKSPNPLDGRL